MANFKAFVAAFAYSAGAVVCHQLPERSFVLGGQQLPVCARCSGLYLGVALGFLMGFAVRRLSAMRPVNARRLLPWLAIVAAPTAVSWASGVLGVWDGTNVIRAALALPLGLAVGAVAAAVVSKDLR